MKKNISSEKSALRKKMLGLRDSMQPDDISRKSTMIQRRLFRLAEFRQAKVIMFYVSFRSEVATHEMIKHSLLSDKVVVPAVNLAQKELEPFYIESLDQLVLGAYGVLEPNKHRKQAGLKAIDLIIVPGCAFDLNGFRLGYGAGYYDKFLAGDHSITSVSLAFELQIVPEIPHETRDIPVNLLVTEKRVIRCPQSHQA